MATKGEQTRDNVLNIAEKLILQKGFCATSIDEVIQESGLTKGGFFYHFKNKNDLARHIMVRYREQDRIFFEGLFARAAELSDDPLQQMLIFVKLLSEAMANLGVTHPGCLVASYTYESEQYDPEIKELAADVVLDWREMFLQQLSRVAGKYPPKEEVSIEALADMLSSIIEGAIVVTRVLSDKDILVKQLLQYRSYLKLLFGG